LRTAAKDPAAASKAVPPQDLSATTRNVQSEEIARDAVTKINTLFEKLIKEDQARRAEAKENES